MFHTGIQVYPLFHKADQDRFLEFGDPDQLVITHKSKKKNVLLFHCSNELKWQLVFPIAVDDPGSVVFS